MCEFCDQNKTKFGKDQKGNQKFRCKICKRVWVINPNSSHLNQTQVEWIEKMLKENISIRAIARLVNCSHVTILNYLRKKQIAF